MYTVKRQRGRFVCVSRDLGGGTDVSFGPNNSEWAEFLDWNAKQPAPLDLSDKAPEPPEPDPVKDAIMALLDKDQNGTITAAEKLDFCFKVCKRLVRNI